MWKQTSNPGQFIRNASIRGEVEVRLRVEPDGYWRAVVLYEGDFVAEGSGGKQGADTWVEQNQ